MSDFEGQKYGDCESWPNFIPIKDQDIKYLEIGVYYGFNLFSVLQTYCKCKNSEVHAIDPWSDLHYNYYAHLTNKGDLIYNTFLNYVNKSDGKDKIHIHRGYSYDKLLNLPNDYFDMIYIDGCHEPESVMEDAVLSFRKLKNDGYIIFDDYNWKTKTTQSIDSFISAYGNKIKLLGINNNQVFIQKITSSHTPSVSFNLV